MSGNILFDMISSSYAFKLDEKGRSTVLISRVPDDQWIQELVWWESVSWASIQIFLTDLAVGMGKEDGFNLQLPTDSLSATEKQLCDMQRMRAPSGFV